MQTPASLPSPKHTSRIGLAAVALSLAGALVAVAAPAHASVPNGTSAPSNTGQARPTIPASPPSNAFWVTRYGADPTGRTDSTVAIRTAVAAAEAAGGNQTLYFPAGTYLLDDATGGKLRGTMQTGQGTSVQMISDITLDGSKGSVVNVLGAGASVTKVVDAVGTSNPEYAGKLTRGYDAFVFANMNGFYFSGLTVDSATYSAGDTLEDFGSNTVIANSDFIGSTTSTSTNDPEVYGLRILGVCQAVPSSNQGAAAGYSGPGFHSGNLIENLTVSGGGRSGMSDLGVACQSNDVISNVTDTGWGLALYEDYGVTVNGYTFSPGSGTNRHPGFYITDSSDMTVNDFTTSGQGGIIAGGGPNTTFNTTISAETMTGAGYTLEVKDAHNTLITGSTLNSLLITGSLSTKGVTVTNSTIGGKNSSETAPPVVRCHPTLQGTISGLDGVSC